MKLILASMVIFSCWASAASACGVFDLGCVVRDIGETVESGAQDVGKAIEKGLTESRGILHPVRQYLTETQIPPEGVGAYGIVALKSKPTPANLTKLMMVCRSFLAHFDRAEVSPYPPPDQMITVWPLDNPEAPLAQADDCGWILDHYVLGAASTAMAYAVKQTITFDGEGPFLIGWSPADSRGKPEKLVLVVDMSTSNDQASIDHNFDFWKDQIVRDPASWRSGFSIDVIRQKIKDFVDHYGDDIVENIKMVGL